MEGRAVSPMVVRAAPLSPTMAASSVQMTTVPMASPPATRPAQR